MGKKDPATVAIDMLKSFRKELLAASELIIKENKAEAEKRNDLVGIAQTLENIDLLINHWVRG